MEIDLPVYRSRRASRWSGRGARERISLSLTYARACCCNGSNSGTLTIPESLEWRLSPSPMPPAFSSTDRPFATAERDMAGRRI